MIERRQSPDRRKLLPRLNSGRRATETTYEEDFTRGDTMGRADRQPYRVN